MGLHAFSQPLKGFGGEPRSTYLSFAPNGSSSPAVANNDGPPGLRATAITYSATGVQTLVFPSDWGFPADTTFTVSAQVAEAGEWFEVCTVGAYNASTRTLVVLTHRSGTGREVAAAAGARVHIGIHFNDSQGG